MLKRTAKINFDLLNEYSRALKIGVNLWHIRKLKNITQKELSDKAKTTQNIISKIEDGTYNPWSELVLKLANALWVPESLLLTQNIDWQLNEIIDVILKKAKSIWKEWIDILWILKLLYFIDLEYSNIKWFLLRNTEYIRYYAWPYDEFAYKSLHDTNNAIFYNKIDLLNKDDTEYTWFELKNWWMKKYSILNNEDVKIINKVLDYYIKYDSIQLKELSYETTPMKIIGATIWWNEWFNQVILWHWKVRL